MPQKRTPDPLDALGAAYEKMYERVVENLEHAEEKTEPLLHKLIDEARDKAIELRELTEEDAHKVAEWLKRDLADVTHYLSETGRELKDWLGFETTLIETSLLDMLKKTADPTTLELLELKEQAELASTWHTGEITGPGTLVCDQCGEKLHFYKAGKIPPCPKCHGTVFHREYA